MFTNVKTKNIHEAMEASDHAFEVEMIPLYTGSGRKVWDKQGVIRKDTEDYLGTVGMGVQHLQPINFYEMAGELISATGGEIDRTITMGGGAIIGISFTLAHKAYLPDDPSSHNLLFLTSYNSSFAINAKAFNTRFCCMNMLANSTKLFSIKNTSGNLPRLKVASNMLKYYHEEMVAFDNKMAALTKIKMTDEEAIAWFGDTLLNPPKKDNKRANSIYDGQLDTFVDLLQNGLGTGVSGVRGTAYGAINAVTEFCNHHRNTRVRDGKSEEEVRFTSNILGGSSDKLMQVALSSLIEMID